MTEYHRYMASREWRLKRREVLERSKGICERCWGAKAKQVHHLTYERVGHELPEDLMAICRADHQFLSATTDVDPVATLPSLARPGDYGWLGAELSSLAGLAMSAREDHKARPDHEETEMVSFVLDWVEDHVRHWSQSCAKLFPSKPESQVAIAPALLLRKFMQDDDLPELARSGEAALSAMGIELSKLDADPWMRWTMPLAWFRKVA